MTSEGWLSAAAVARVPSWLKPDVLLPAMIETSPVFEISYTLLRQESVVYKVSNGSITSPSSQPVAFRFARVTGLAPGMSFCNRST